MRQQRGYITCAVATGNGFAMPYRVKQAPNRHVYRADELDDRATAISGGDSRQSMTRRPLLAGVLATLAKGKRAPKC